jgi:hypothetical protein
VTSKRRKWLLVLAGLVVAATLTVWLTRDREPSYEGKPLSFWILHNKRPGGVVYGGQMIPNPPSPLKDQARDAIRHMGPDAIPYLVKWMQFDSWGRGVRQTVQEFSRKLPPSIAPTFLCKCSDTAGERAAAAADAFSVLGDDARSAVPDLIALVNSPGQTERFGNAIRALDGIGSNAIPALSAHISNTNAFNREQTIQALMMYPTLAKSGAPALPALVRCLEDPDGKVRYESATALALRTNGDKAHAALVVPALTRCLRDRLPQCTDIEWGNMQCRMAGLLAFYGEEARIAVPHLLQMAQSPDPHVHGFATNALLRIAPAALTNAPPP